MNRKIIYHVENRGSSYIYHWLVYMISGLRHIKNKKPTMGFDGSGKFEQNIGLYNQDFDKPPYRIYISNELSGVCAYKKNDYQRQTIELLKDDFIFIEKDEISSDDIIINNYGEPLYLIDGDDINNRYVNSLNDENSKLLSSKDGYQFLRDIGNKVEITEDDISKYKNKKFFLSRKNSHLLEGNSSVGQIKRRQILNEDELVNKLKEYDIDFIFLEDYTLEEKIKIFKLASLIISPNSGGLTFSLYSDENTNIVELNVANPHQISKQYYDICEKFNIPYTKFTCSKVDNYDNMSVDINSFISYLKNNNLINELSYSN
jgi:hypothetical protein